MKLNYGYYEDEYSGNGNDDNEDDIFEGSSFDSDEAEYLKDGFSLDQDADSLYDDEDDFNLEADDFDLEEMDKYLDELDAMDDEDADEY